MKMSESPNNTADAAIELAAELLRQAVRLQTPQERRQQAEFDRMIGHDADKATLVEMTDQAFRTHAPARVANQLTHILDVQGVPRFFSPMEKTMLRGFHAFGGYLPGVAVPMVKERMRRETANVILPAERKLLADHLRNRAQQGVQMNVNLLGEAILGEDEAKRRSQRLLEVLRMEEVPCVSIKISTLYSQVSALARRHTISKVADRLEILYRTAAAESNGSSQGKFVYLDMEEYRDLYLTADILTETLDREGLQDVRAGIALQAYIPDSYTVMQSLLDWSSRRVQSGGGPLTIRLVKGANMEMERVDASVGGHPQAPYQSKQETDANFKRMLWDLVSVAADGNVRLGVASHNLFDVALAMIWTEQLGAGGVQYEMLEGMANHQRRAISERDVPMLLYAPACDREAFLNAIGYLIRRLDENTGPQNFLRHAYRLRPDTPEFESLADDFRASLAIKDSVSCSPRRQQDRRQVPDQPPVANHWSQLVNEPDTDWSLPHNTQWAEQIVQQWEGRCDANAVQVDLSVGGQSVSGGEQLESTDPSRPGVVVCQYSAATLQQATEAVKVAADDPSGWRRSTPQFRHEVLRAVAQKLRENRGGLIGAMIADGGKTIGEADPEVSEAIDFCEFYPLTANEWFSQHDNISVSPRGVVAVITPWNFPLAIPCGGISAALAAGNTVILKPASETVLTASRLCQAFWEAGVPHDALQLIPCRSKVAEEALVCNPAVDAVILTGSTQTAKRMLTVRPGLHLLAETGGKNATIVTAMADRDLAIKHVIHSAFSHSGQKCSATSLLLLENEVFEDEKFRESLADAVRSLHVGSAWDLHTKMGPLIRPPTAELTRGLKTLEDDESWLVVPEHVVGNPNLFRPGVKWNVKPGGFTHLTELFGPVLGVMPFSRLEQAIEIVRSTGYGLTSGLESLDEREIELWKQSMDAGNLYINRPTTGAIVLRQPFGGVGLSAYGPGVKAGGPHYVLALAHVRDADQSDQADVIEHENEPLDKLRQWLEVATVESSLESSLEEELVGAMQSQRKAVAEEFSREHDTLRIVGQDNVRRYRPVRALTIRVTASDSIRDAIVAVSAAAAVGAQTTLSMDPEVANRDKELLESAADHVPGLIHPHEESESALAERIRSGHVNRLRLLARGDAASPVAAACAETFVTIIDEPVLRTGCVECLRYLDEQSVSHDYHRYGNLGRRANEDRRAVL